MRMKCRAMTYIVQFSLLFIVVVSAFFYFSIDSHAKTNWYDSSSINAGDGSVASYTIEGIPMYNISNSVIGNWRHLDGYYVPLYQSQPSSNYENFTLNWGLPVATWNNGAGPAGAFDKVHFTFYTDVNIDFDWEGTSSNVSYYEKNISVTSAELLFEGKSYECVVLPSGNGNYRIYYNSIIDVPSGALNMFNSSITLRVSGHMSSLFYITTDDIPFGVKAFYPKMTCKVGGIGGAWKYQFRRGRVVDDSISAIEDQTNSLNNSTKNQTDTLTNGFDDSKGSTVNNNFSASVNDYHAAEDSLFTSAKSGLDNFEFIDFTTISGMVTSLSFVTSIMSSIYLAMGGDLGPSGIILAVLFSVMIVSMTVGLYRYYVSNGRSSSKGGD